MNNMQRLCKDGNKNHRIFANIVTSLRNTCGFYGRLYESVNELDEDGYEKLYDTLSQQSFNDEIDVILWLES